ncbi:response regulator [Rhodopirellula bahusiensis]|uniref:response regulator n=1 Tax=Rhodopirellula bahusiensis TaxID=2014065 RepID=UPI003D65A504
MSRSTKQIVIVDDHPSTRDGLLSRVALEPDLEVIGEASDFDEAIEVIGKVRPDLAVIDVSLKYSSGIDLVKAIKCRYPRVKMWSGQCTTSRCTPSGPCGPGRWDTSTSSKLTKR